MGVHGLQIPWYVYASENSHFFYCLFIKLILLVASFAATYHSMARCWPSLHFTKLTSTTSLMHWFAPLISDSADGEWAVSHGLSATSDRGLSSRSLRLRARSDPQRRQTLQVSAHGVQLAQDTGGWRLEIVAYPQLCLSSDMSQNSGLSLTLPIFWYVSK